MKLLIIPKPVLDINQNAWFYCFRFQRVDEMLVPGQPSRRFDGVINSPCLEVMEMVGLDAFTNGIAIFVPLSKLSLLADVEKQCSAPPEKVIFLFNHDLRPEEPFLSRIKQLKEMGYRFALEQVYDYEDIGPLLTLCDFVFISIRPEQPRHYKEALNYLRYYYSHITCIASDVNNITMFDNIRDDRFNFYEGKFYSQPVRRGYNTLSPIKVNRIQLLNTVRNEDFDIEEVGKIVRKDPALSISLLRFVNASFSDRSQQIKTIQHAVAMLGQKEVRKWVTTAATSMLAEDRPDEITKLSLMRAKFAENLAPYFRMNDLASELFLMGLFSMLDVILEITMQEALKMITVSETIQDALVYQKGNFGDVLNFMRTYETSDWHDVSRIMILYNLKAQDVFGAYINAVRWYGSIIADTSDYAQ